MQRDDLVRGVFGRGIYPLFDRLARGGTEFVVEQRVAEAAHQCLERLFAKYIETAQQQGAAFMQAFLGQRMQGLEAPCAGLLRLDQ
ncbi:hypothetical protein D9M71_628180 [compost metagenome]